MRSLFIGRFQPFHGGHLKVLNKAIRESDSVIIGIGSAQFSNTPENPFTAGERAIMIQKLLRTLKARDFYIIPVENVGNNELWASKVETLSPKFDAVYTNNPIVNGLFKSRGYQMKSTGLIHRKEFSGTYIRKRIATGKSWENLVPKTIAEEIKRINGVERIRKLSNNL